MARDVESRAQAIIDRFNEYCRTEQTVRDRIDYMKALEKQLQGLQDELNKPEEKMRNE